jgi:flavin reductase (DIM6/NTAB) family NADH-FMN oxidoreductase RutF/DNA-binding IclR family transcriptional regulator
MPPSARKRPRPPGAGAPAPRQRGKQEDVSVSEAPPSLDSIDPKRFRHVLGHFPTGVAVVTAAHAEHGPVGMAVGSFTSVSLDPPLVAFLPDRSSSSFPRIRETGSFCVNVLADDQEPVCRAFATRGVDKYAGNEWIPGPTGSPILSGAVAWIDCDIGDVLEAGDHYIVVGRVRDLQVAGESSPLLFFRGGYGRFSTASLSAPAAPDLLSHLRQVDRARPEMERVAEDLGLECLAVAPVGDELVTVASAGHSFGHQAVERVGQRMPFVPPLGALFLAWAEPEAVDRWLRRLGSEVGPDEAAMYRRMVERVRTRGWSLALRTRGQIAFELALAEWTSRGGDVQHEAIHRAALQLGTASHERTDAELAMPVVQVRNISAPVWDDRGVVLMLTLIGLPTSSHFTEVERYRQRLLRGARLITEALGGSDQPAPADSAGAADQ